MKAKELIQILSEAPELNVVMGLEGVIGNVNKADKYDDNGEKTWILEE